MRIKQAKRERILFPFWLALKYVFFMRKESGSAEISPAFPEGRLINLDPLDLALADRLIFIKGL